jgi:hypothetical protein
VSAEDAADKALSAKISATSELALGELKASGEWTALDKPMALLLPVGAGRVPAVTVTVKAKDAVALQASLWGSSRAGNTTPDVKLGETQFSLAAGEQKVRLEFEVSLGEAAHVFYMLQPAQGVEIALSDEQVTGVLTLAQKMNKAVAKSLVQTPPENSGIDTFAYWLPDRRPMARNLAVAIEPALEMFAAKNVVNGVARPWRGVNAWVPSVDDARPSLKLTWDEPQKISEIEISFDTDFDHPMESVLMGHPERVMPACVTEFEVCAGGKGQVAHVVENHQTRWVMKLEHPVDTSELSVIVLGHGPALPAIFEVRCY